MSFIPIEYNQHTGWLCNNDLILICDKHIAQNDTDCPFIDDNQFEFNRKRCRFIPKVDFNDEKLFPMIKKLTKKSNDDEIRLELNSMLACKEYVSKQNHFFDRKQFQQAQAEQIDQEKKFEEKLKKRQEEQYRIEKQQRRRQHPSYISRFDEKRYVPSIRKKL